MLRRGNQGEAAFRYAGFPRSLRSPRNDKRAGTPAPDVIAFFLLSFRATPRNLGVSRISLRRILHCVQNDNMCGTPAPDVIAFFLLSFRATPRNLGVSRISLRRILHCVQNDNMCGTPAPDVIAFFLLSFRTTPRNLGVSRISLRRISTTMPTHRGLWLSPFAKAVATLVSAFVTHCKQVDSLGIDGMAYGEAVLLFC